MKILCFYYFTTTNGYEPYEAKLMALRVVAADAEVTQVIHGFDDWATRIDEDGFRVCEKELKVFFRKYCGRRNT